MRPVYAHGLKEVAIAQFVVWTLKIIIGFWIKNDLLFNFISLNLL